MNARVETSKALRLFLHTIVALQTANDADEDAIDVVNRQVGRHRLLQIKPGLEAMVENGDASPLAMAAEQHANVRKGVPSDLHVPLAPPARPATCGDSDPEKNAPEGVVVRSS